MTPSQTPIPLSSDYGSISVRLLQVIAVFLVLCGFNSMKAAVINANSPSLSDVQAAVNQSHDGDTVNVPAGTAIWASNLLINDSISLIGAGSNSTFIVDNNANRSISGCLINASVDNNAEFRISGFCFEGANNGEAEDYNGEIEIGGTCFQVRVDHCYCTNYNGPMLLIYGWIYGVCDHCDFIANFRQGAQVYNCATMNGSLYGDGSWAAPEMLGSSNAFFFENNYFDDQATFAAANAIDCFDGSRVVFRYNVCQDTAPETHGTDSSGRERGFRTLEVYCNWLTNSAGNAPSYGQFRGGTGLCYSNTYSQGYGAVMDMETYRAFYANAYFGGGTGVNPWDSNSGTIFDSGTCGSVSSGVLTMTDISKNWTANQWVNYTLYDTNTGYASVIQGNTATTISFVDGSSVSGSSYLKFTVGDHYEITKPIALIDQDGRGQGDLLTNTANYQPYDTVTGKANWPNEKIEPIYYWSNTVGGVLSEPWVNSSPTVQLNRDYYEDVIPSGYTAYTFPHPLDTTTNTVSSSSNYTLTVVNGTGTGSYTNTAVVSISANEANTVSNGAFGFWNGSEIANTNSASTTVTMPASNLTVTAIYAPKPGGPIQVQTAP
jgi:hypothetical protein